MIWNDETRTIYRAWVELHITSGELVECYSVVQRKPRELRWTILDSVRWCRLIAG